jgi:hypothetical protein
MSEIDLSEFRQKPEKKCKAAKQIDRLDKDDQSKVIAAFLEPDISNQSISEFMTKRGIPTSRDTLRLHRVGECSCD